MHHASPIGRFKSDEERVAVVRTSLSLGPLDDLMTATQSEHIFAALEYDVGGAQDVQKTIAVALGYDPSGGDGWPSWIDELAAEIEALPRPREIRLADPTKHEDGFGAASHDYHVVFGRRSPGSVTPGKVSKAGLPACACVRECSGMSPQPSSRSLASAHDHQTGSEKGLELVDAGRRPARLKAVVRG